MIEITPKQAGFSLIEVLVAFALLAMAFALVVPLFSENAAHTQRAFNERRAQLIAESLLAEVDAMQPLTEGEARSVGDDGFTRIVRITETADMPPDNPYHLTAFDISVLVSWDSSAPAVRLHTLKLARASQ
jgi:general secretion pathway protein I